MDRGSSWEWLHGAERSVNTAYCVAQFGQEIMKHVALQRYLICDRQELPVSYVKQAEKQLKHLVTLIGPNDGDDSYFVNQHAPTHRTIYEDLAVQKYLKRKKLQASSSKLDNETGI